MAKLSSRPEMANYGAEIRATGFFKFYGQRLSEQDLETLAKWKKEVNKIVAYIKRVLSSEGEEKAYIESVIGKNPDDSHIVRFAISTRLCKLRIWHDVISTLKAVRAMIVPWESNLSRFGQVVGFCADNAIAGQALSDEFGFRNTIITHPGRHRHAFDLTFHQAVQFEDGAIFDPSVYPHLQGYLANFDREPAERKRGTERTPKQLGRKFSKTVFAVIESSEA